MYIELEKYRLNFWLWVVGCGLLVVSYLFFVICYLLSVILLTPRRCFALYTSGPSRISLWKRKIAPLLPTTYYLLPLRVCDIIGVI